MSDAPFFGRTIFEKVAGILQTKSRLPVRYMMCKAEVGL